MRGVYAPRPGDIKEKVLELKSRLRDSGISLAVTPGSEVYLASRTAREYRAGKLQTIGDAGYLLVEARPYVCRRTRGLNSMLYARPARE